MKNEEAMKLMELLIRMGYSNDCIRLTLISCEMGMGIGHSLAKAIKQIESEHEQ